MRALQPLINKVAEMSLEAFDHEETKMLTGKQRLLKIETSLARTGFDAIERLAGLNEKLLLTLQLAEHR